MDESSDYSTEIKVDLKEIVSKASVAAQKCAHRGLNHSSKWLMELVLAAEKNLPDHRPTKPGVLASEISDEEFSKYLLAKSYFDLREFQRAEHLLKGCQSPVTQFLMFYSSYMSEESNQSQHDLFELGDPNSLATLTNELLMGLQDLYKADTLNPHTSYLYGVVLKKRGYLDESKRALIRAVTGDPYLWCAWQELTHFVQQIGDLQSIELPDHFMKYFFLGQCYYSLQQNDLALSIYTALRDAGLQHSINVTDGLARCYGNIQDIDMAIQHFNEVIANDPYRLEGMDKYSNNLYVKEMKVELTDLANRCVSIDKYRPETCCVLGNYYSMRVEHEHAVLYFQRALKLDPSFLSAWVLMGHEYMEMSNPSAAIHAYRQAVERDPRDYCAWYGLGQTHEVLKMPHYSLYYFQQALRLRPNDSRMLVAVGVTYEKLDKPQEAKICYWKANKVGDVQGLALSLLGKLHERLKEDENAATAYTSYVIQNYNSEFQNTADMALAYKFIANYNLKIEKYHDAYLAATKCLEYPETREEGKSLLEHITQASGLTFLGESRPADAPMEAHNSLTDIKGMENNSTLNLAPMNLKFASP